MTDVSAIGSSSSTGAAAAQSASETASLNQLDSPQVFLQLLVAELQNQDPTNPTNPSTILQQTSSLAQMQAINSMSSAITSDQSSSETGEATGLIGHSITATVSGSAVTGTVTGVTLDSTGTPSLTVNGSAVPLSAVTAIQ